MGSLRAVLGTAVIVGCTACTPVDHGARADATPSVKPQPQPQPQLGHVVTTLQTRDHEITVYATAAGPRFTVAASGGVVLAQQLTTTEFRSSFPGLHQRYDSAFAEDGAHLDASLTLPPDAVESTPPSSRDTGRR